MEEKITLFLVEVGVLEDKVQTKKQKGEYIPAYDEQFHYRDENFIVFLESEPAVTHALGYVINGVVNTYAVCKELEIPKEWLDEDDIRDIKSSGIFDGWSEVFEGERLECKHIILDIYKSEDKTIKFDFINKQFPTIKEEVLKNFTKTSLIEKCRRDDEMPMGVLLTYIKDMYGLPKTKGWDIAASVLDELKVENKMY